MLKENVYLILGCYGRKEDGFTLCPAAENRILKVDDSLSYIDEIWSYLESVGLLDKPLININAVRNLIFRMQERFDQKIKRLWSEKDFNTIERFMQMHKPCGLYIRLLLVEEEDSESLILEPPEKVKISGIKIEEEPESVTINNVISMRSRR